MVAAGKQQKGTTIPPPCLDAQEAGLLLQSVPVWKSVTLGSNAEVGSLNEALCGDLRQKLRPIVGIKAAM
eukprot:1896895-Amphidinium_carterae.2